MSKYLLTLLLIIPLVLVTLSCTSPQKSSENEFDHICQIYTTIMQDPKNDKLSLGDKMDLIGNEIESSVKSKPAISAHEASMLSSPKNRYGMFKEVAEYELGRPWSCEILKNWGNIQNSSNKN